MKRSPAVKFFFIVMVMIVTLSMMLVPLVNQVSAEESGTTGQAESGNLLMTGPIQMNDINGHWAEATIDHMLRKTIAYGFLDGTFRPDQPMSRLDVALMLVKGLGLETWKTAEGTLDELLSFTDVSGLTAEQKKYIYIVSGLGYMIGDQAGTFRPGEPITRDEFATILESAGI